MDQYCKESRPMHLWKSREKLGRKIKELGLILFCEAYEILKAPFLSLIPRHTVCWMLPGFLFHSVRIWNLFTELKLCRSVGRVSAGSGQKCQGNSHDVVWCSLKKGKLWLQSWLPSLTTPSRHPSVTVSMQVSRILVWSEEFWRIASRWL